MINLFDGYFAKPVYLYLLIILVPIIIWYIIGNKKSQAAIQVSTLKNIAGIKPSYKYYLRHLPFIFRLLALTALIVVLARPQKTDTWKDVTTEGVDILMALDVSSSMLARDFKPDRLEASKDVAIEFISSRPGDRMGLVVFSGESFAQCPLTVDHAVLINLVKEIKSGMLEDGTAIGLGLANAVNRLKDSKSKSKVIILLTDGVNNSGSIPPLTAAEIAKMYGIRVYT
ncbi:MAG: vWA domain-containing protein, partial [Bacteroidota bacterium]